MGATGLLLGVIGTILGATGRTGNTLHENGRNWEQLGPCGGGRGGKIHHNRECLGVPGLILAVPRKLEPPGGSTWADAGSSQCRPREPRTPFPAVPPLQPQHPPPGSRQCQGSPPLGLPALPFWGSPVSGLPLREAAALPGLPQTGVPPPIPRGPGRARRARPGQPNPHRGGTRICLHPPGPQKHLPGTPDVPPRAICGSAALQEPNMAPKTPNPGTPSGYLGRAPPPRAPAGWGAMVPGG